MLIPVLSVVLTAQAEQRGIGFVIVNPHDDPR